MDEVSPCPFNDLETKPPNNITYMQLTSCPEKRKMILTKQLIYRQKIIICDNCKHRQFNFFTGKYSCRYKHKLRFSKKHNAHIKKECGDYTSHSR